MAQQSTRFQGFEAEVSKDRTKATYVFALTCASLHTHSHNSPHRTVSHTQ